MNEAIEVDMIQAELDGLQAEMRTLSDALLQRRARATKLHAQLRKLGILPTIGGTPVTDGPTTDDTSYSLERHVSLVVSGMRRFVAAVTSSGGDGVVTYRVRCRDDLVVEFKAYVDGLVRDGLNAIRDVRDFSGISTAFEYVIFDKPEMNSLGQVILTILAPPSDRISATSRKILLDRLADLKP